MILGCEHIGTLTTHHQNRVTKVKAVSTEESREQRAEPTGSLRELTMAAGPAPWLESREHPSEQSGLGLSHH